jgi:RNA polymerase sigma factor (sigma-70 family)
MLATELGPPESPPGFGGRQSSGALATEATQSKAPDDWEAKRHAALGSADVARMGGVAASVMDEERKRHRYLAFLDLFFRREQIEADTNCEADARLQELLTANLDSLSWEERELILRKYFARESVKEIAADVGATEKAIESQLVRMRRKLKAGVLAQLNHETRI